MKHIKNILNFFRGNKLKSFLVIVILTSAMVIFTVTISQIRYYTLTLSYIDKPEFENGLYLQANTYGNYDQAEKCEELLETAQALPYVEGTAGFPLVLVDFNNYSAALFLTNDFTAKEFKPDISEGCWLNECEEGDIPNAVIGGTIFKNVQVGSDIEVNGINLNGRKQKLHVIGKIKYPYYYMYFSSGSGTSATDESAYINDHLSLADSSCSGNGGIYILDNKKNRSMFSEKCQLITVNSLLAFKENATKEQRSVVKEQLKKLNRPNYEDGYTNQAYLELNGIIDYTKEDISNRISQQLPFVLFILIIATASAVIVSFLNVKQKQQNDYASFLCGCSKRANLIYNLISIFILAIIPTIITCLYIYFVPTLAEAGVLQVSQICYDVYSYLYVIGYAVFVSMIAFFISSFSIIRKQPIELYKDKLIG